MGILTFLSVIQRNSSAMQNFIKLILKLLHTLMSHCTDATRAEIWRTCVLVGSCRGLPCCFVLCKVQLTHVLTVLLIQQNVKCQTLKQSALIFG